MHDIVKRMWSATTTAVRTTPVEFAIVVATGGLISASIHDRFLEPESLISILLTAFLALCVTFSISAAHVLKVFNGRTRWLLTGVFAVVTASYGAFVLDVGHTTELWRFGFLTTAALMGIALVPVAARLGSASVSERFWRYNLRLGFRTIVAAGYAVSLFAGLALALVAVDELLGVRVSDEAFAHLFNWIGLGLGGVLALAGLSDVKRIDQPLEEGSMVWFGRLGTWLFIPLVVVYLGIMYFYLARIAMTGDVPSNLLSPLALGAGLLGYLGSFVLHPFLNRADFRPLSRVLRAFPAAFIGLVPLGMWAVWQRVAQYGWTEFRYARMAALICLGIFSLVGVVKWIRRQEMSLANGPAVVGIVASLAAVGPWSASHVSKMSQHDRLVERLEAAELLAADGGLLGPDELSAPLQQAEVEHGREVREQIGYLLENHGDDSIADLTDVSLAGASATSVKLGRLGFGKLPDEHYQMVSFYADADDALEVSGPGIVTDFSVSSNYESLHRGFTFRLDEDQLHAQRAGVRGTADLSRFCALAAQGDTGELDDSDTTVQLRDASGRVVGKMLLRDLQVEHKKGVWSVRYISALLKLSPPD